MKRLVSIVLTLCLACAPLCAQAASELSFSAANDISQLKALNGKEVTIMGYMATLSPISGKYMYLMNLPYQSCPFCVPNTQQLANTMAVYAKSGKTFEFTDRAVRVTGILRVEDYEDEFGYTYNYRITDAVYRVVDMSELPAKYALWQTVASDGIIADVYAMFDYLHFVCQWQDYLFNYYDENDVYRQVNIYPGDVMNFLEDDGPYGYKTETDPSYYPGLIARVRAISATELKGLTDILESCEEIRDYALTCLYSNEFEYIEAEDRFTQNNYDELYDLWYGVWYDFSVWLETWQM